MTSIPLWLTISGMIISGSIALVIAHLHRRQMRQVELFRQNPEVGLLPPPGPLKRFVKSHWDAVFGVGGPVLWLVWTLFSSAPMTRAQVYLIALFISLLATNLLGQVIMRVSNRLVGLIEKERELRAASDAQISTLMRLLDKGADVGGSMAESLQRLDALVAAMISDTADNRGLSLNEYLARLELVQATNRSLQSASP